MGERRGRRWQVSLEAKGEEGKEEESVPKVLRRYQLNGLEF
jgi:hypothetical protein